jgi:hypothetical protein
LPPALAEYLICLFKRSHPSLHNRHLVHYTPCTLRNLFNTLNSWTWRAALMGSHLSFDEFRLGSSLNWIGWGL